MRQPPSSPPPPAKRGISCLSRNVLFGVLVLFLVAGYAQVVRPAVSDYLANRVGLHFGLGQVPGGNNDVPAPAASRENLGQVPGGNDVPAPAASGENMEYIQQQANNTIPVLIEALPRGQFRVADGEINDYLAANPEAIKPFEKINIAFLRDRAEVTLQAFGTDNQVTFELDVQEGMMVVKNPQLKGPMGYLISFENLTRTLERQINEQLQVQGRTVQQIRLEPGAVVTVLE